jgi:hypothetical protein
VIWRSKPLCPAGAKPIGGIEPIDESDSRLRYPARHSVAKLWWASRELSAT